MLFIFDMGGVVTNDLCKKKCSDWLNITKEQFFFLCGHDDDCIDFNNPSFIKWYGESEKIDYFNLLNLGKISVSDFWKKFEENARISKIAIPSINHDLFKLTFHPEINQKTVELIKVLRKNHRVVCGTNTIDTHWESHMERGDYSYFDRTYASNKIGAIKPNPDFYRLIMEAEGYEPKNTFFTDDKAVNIKTAKELGINAIQFKSAEEVSEAWKQYCL